MMERDGGVCEKKSLLTGNEVESTVFFPSRACPQILGWPEARVTLALTLLPKEERLLTPWDKSVALSLLWPDFYPWEV